MDIQKSMQIIFDDGLDETGLWDGRYKIPWDDPDFSRRMLAEHLSQDHDLASRKKETIDAQVRWIHENIAGGSPAGVLDMGCGPGLYVECLMKRGYTCRGIDFSPASIAHARSRVGDKAVFIEGDVRYADFGHDHDLAMMLFGELNVFSPDECRALLKKAGEALVPGGTLLIEVHTFETIKRAGEAPNSWYRSGPGIQGLFSDDPHICLIENHWFEHLNTARQTFFIIDAAQGGVTSYRNTTKAWTEEEYEALLAEAGFTDITRRTDWPVTNEDFILFSGLKAP